MLRDLCPDHLDDQQGRFHKGFINPKPEGTPLIPGDRLSPQGLYRDSCIITGSNVTCSTTTVEARKLQHDKLITLKGIKYTESPHQSS